MTLDVLSPAKKFLLVAASALALVLSLVGIPAFAANAAVTYGGVSMVDSQGDPVTGATVRLIMDDESSAYVFTGPDGDAPLGESWSDFGTFDARVAFALYPIGVEPIEYIWNGATVVEGPEDSATATALFDAASTTLLELQVPFDQPDGAVTGQVSLSPAVSGDWSSSVALYDAGTGDFLTHVSTVSSGHFAFSGVPAGSYKLQFLGHVTGTGNINYDYASRWYQNKPSFDTATAVSVTDSTVSGINQTLQAVGVVKGLLGDTSGMEGPAVAFFPSSWSSGTPDWDSPDIQWALPWNDIYEIKLAAGSYRVAFGDRVTAGSSGDEIEYDFTLEEYWDGSSTLGGSTVVTLAAGQTRTINGLNAPSFTDVPSGNQFALEITWLADTGITTGHPDGSFRPWDSVRRDAMAAFLYRFAGEPAFDAPSTSPFLDVTPSTPFYKEITWLADTGITTGWDVPGGKEFRPQGTVNRDAMAAFIYRFVESPEWDPPSSSPFSDVPTSRAFFHEITWLATTGITTGYPDGTFRPLNSVSRDAMAAFLFRLSKLVA